MPDLRRPDGAGPALAAGAGKRPVGHDAPPRMCRPAFWALGAVVVVAHLLFTNGLLQDRVGWGSGDKPPARIDVTFVRELVAAAPPAAAPAAATPAERRLPTVAAKPQAAASAPQAAASAAETDTPAPLAVAATPAPPAEAPPPPPAPVEITPAVAAAPPEPQPAPPGATPGVTPGVTPGDTPGAPLTTAAVMAPAVASTPPAAASAAAFEWPPSTRMNYRLTGNYRGPVEGTASVEWLRQGVRYQVRLQTSIGPVMSRSSSSEGELTTQGLAPRRFDGEQKVMFRAARRWQLRFGPERVVLSDGSEVPAIPGAQDEASQFVQLTWLFTTQPDKLQVGKSVEMPLAINRKLERWIYDVVGEELLRFPFGNVATFHLKPRREARGGDLTSEVWIAPTLQYLPVRILIRDNKDNSIDLQLEKPPLQAAPGAR